MTNDALEQLKESDRDLEKAVRKTGRDADQAAALVRLSAAFDARRRSREKLVLREYTRVPRKRPA